MCKKWDTKGQLLCSLDTYCPFCLKLKKQSFSHNHNSSSEMTFFLFSSVSEDNVLPIFSYFVQKSKHNRKTLKKFFWRLPDRMIF